MAIMSRTTNTAERTRIARITAEDRLRIDRRRHHLMHAELKLRDMLPYLVAPVARNVRASRINAHGVEVTAPEEMSWAGILISRRVNGHVTRSCYFLRGEGGRRGRPPSPWRPTMKAGAATAFGGLR